jgi:superfamily II DNA or RNA helicase
MSVDFLGKYQNLYLLKNPQFNPYGDLSLNQSIYNKKEFHDLKLKRVEDRPSKGDLYNHQKFISRYLSSYTLYPSLLLFHEPGTGKSCSAFAVTEKIKSENSSIKGALILARGQGLIDNLINELVFKCTKGQYIPEDFESLTKLEKKIRIKKMISHFYDFETFAVFAKKVSKWTDEKIISDYSDLVIIIDEVHNLRLTDEGEDKDIKTYENIHRFLHLVKNCKILLMSGTPMKDQPEEIATIMNLILPLNKQLPTDKEFVNQYLEKEDDILKVKDDKEEILKSQLNGYISYLKSMLSDDVRKNYIGQKTGELKFFQVDIDKMSDFQGKVYNQAYKSDTSDEKDEKSKKSGVYSNSRQATLFVFPDGSYGSEGFKKYIKISTVEYKIKGKKVVKKSYNLSRELLNAISGSTKEESLEKLKKFSSKYHQTISQILAHPNQNCFVYNELVEGSGSILFGKLLDFFGISNEVITTKTTESSSKINRIISTFNKVDNKNGANLRVIVGSSVIGEGFTLNNVQQIHILTPYWNYSETEQAIARGIRLNSHKDLLKDGPVTVDIYQHASIYIPKSGEKIPSIDLKMYVTSEDKDLAIKGMERILKEVAIDCEINKSRNIRYDENTRDCDYNECEYTCQGVSKTDYQDDKLTFNLYYSDDLIQTIKEGIKSFFNKTFWSRLDNLEKEVLPSKVGDLRFQMLAALSEIINNREIIKNPYGFDSFLAEDKNIYYLTNNNYYFSNFTDNFYDSNPILRDQINFDVIFANIYSDSFPNILKNLIEEKDNKKRTLILRTISLEIQLLILESCILSKKLNLSKNKEFRDWILTFYNEYIHIIDGIDLINLGPFIRCLHYLSSQEGYTWMNCGDEIVKKFNQKKEEIKENLINENDYGYYGIFQKNKNKFMIRDITDEKFIEDIDNRNKTRGRDCKTWDKSKLIKMIYDIGLKIPDGFEDYTLDKKNIYDLTREDLINQAINKNKFTKVFVEDGITIDQLENMNTEVIRSLIFWASQNKDKVTCKYILDWMKESELIEYQ